MPEAFQLFKGGLQRRAGFQVVILHAALDQKNPAKVRSSTRIIGVVGCAARSLPTKGSTRSVISSATMFGQAIEHVNSGVEFGGEIGHLHFHFAVAGKSEVDRRPMKAPAERMAL